MRCVIGFGYSNVLSNHIGLDPTACLANVCCKMQLELTHARHSLSPDVLALSSCTYSPPLPLPPTDEERIGQKRRKKLDHYTNFFRGGHGGPSGGGPPPPPGGDPGAGGLGDGGQGAGEGSCSY